MKCAFTLKGVRAAVCQKRLQGRATRLFNENYEFPKYPVSQHKTKRIIWRLRLVVTQKECSCKIL